jgi:hypothetical protein
MGNACCNNAEKDVNVVDYSTKPQARKNGEEAEEVDPDLLRRAEENKEMIVRLQANTRGFLARK